MNKLTSEVGTEYRQKQSILWGRMVLNIKPKSPLAGWGNYPISSADLFRPERSHQLSQTQGCIIPRGLGRSYGDAALNADHQVLLMERLRCMLDFDEKTGILRADAGVTFEEILDVFVPRGWFFPVTPGTKYVTLGGCVACDVHGKNHHWSGTLGAHIKELEVVLADGSRRRCTPKTDENLFWATIGGMGLTGIISEVTVQLIPIETAYMIVQHHSTNDLDTTLDTLGNSEKDDKYSVAWIDCLTSGGRMGRSIVMNGHHAQPGEISSKSKDLSHISKKGGRSIPFDLPSWVLNSLTVKAFNAFYYKWQSRKNYPFIVDYDHYFYPLDSISHWNRLYGKRGFVQYQFVVPGENSREALKVILGKFVQSKRASFLAVLKRFGQEGKGMLSFPREGYTLALDLPVSDGLFPLLDEIDELVLKYGGRVYLAKDARMKPETFRAMYPRYPEWRRVKAAVDPEGRFHSDLSRRLGIEEKR